MAAAGGEPSSDLFLVQQLRRGDREAGHRFFRENFPSVYRYLLWLTKQPDQAADLTQETFLQAWRHLDRFDGRAPLRPWLHQIARREFLHAVRSRRAQLSLEQVSEIAAPGGGEWADAVELRDVLRRLPIQEREIVVLHYLEGYRSEEIGRIMGLPPGTVRRRLTEARARLQCELGEDDLTYLNESSMPMRGWAWLPLERMYVLEARLTSERAAEREGPGRGATTEDNMERREFLRQAAVSAAGVVMQQTEKEVVDRRLIQKVTCGFKGTALSDLCHQLRADTGVHVAAGPSVGDEKVTLFCEKLPLREVMRQLSRPFGYTWLRSGRPGQCRYELVQDLRSQLLEEELRNRDRNAALLALDREMEQYRPYLGLSPEEAQAAVKTAPLGEQPPLERLAGPGWGPIQMYFRLSPPEQAALRAGQELRFSQDSRDPGPVDRSTAPPGPLPPDMARGVLQARRDIRILHQDSSERGSNSSAPDGRPGWAWASETSRGLPPSAVPEARAAVSLRLSETELDQFSLSGESTVYMEGWGNNQGSGHVAVGRSPAVLDPENARRNARLAGDPSLRQPITLQPQPSCRECLTGSSTDAAGAEAEGLEPRATSADVLEALHRATGLPIIADFYTRLYPPAAVSVSGQPLFEALNRLADGMRLRWHKEGEWLQFRSVSFYDDRLKEVPNRLLSRWAQERGGGASWREATAPGAGPRDAGGRREHGSLTLDALTEIAGLPDAALDAREMGEGARTCWGLAEWELACNRELRPHLRWMAGLTPAQRQKLQHAPGLRFTELALPQQQQFIALAAGPSADAIRSVEELASATVQVDYSLPGQFEWKPPRSEEPAGPPAPPELLTPVRARTREAVLAAARPVDLQAELSQIEPTRLSLVLLYRWGTPQSNGSLWITAHGRSRTGINRTDSRMSEED